MNSPTGDDIFDVAVVGGGPAGLASAISACQNRARVILIERERRLGGILKQCVHGGFGLIEFKDPLTGPEYAERFVEQLLGRAIEVCTSTFVLEASRDPRDSTFRLTLQNGHRGIFEIRSKTVVLATGCRERTARQVWIHGSRPSGIFTAGTAQYLVNVKGLLPCTKCVILGSGDVGLIMARRLTLEGARVLGVYEVKPEPTGLPRNIAQCLRDYGIPLHLSHTVTRVYGDERLQAVEISRVDSSMRPIHGTTERVECDGLILAVGLMPENEVAEQLGVEISPVTKGPVVDQDLMTSVPGVFACGNCLAVYDLVDYVTETGRIAGKAAAKYDGRKSCGYATVEPTEDFLYCVPQRLRVDRTQQPVRMYFRAARTMRDVEVVASSGTTLVGRARFLAVRPQQVDTLTLEIPASLVRKRLILEAREVVSPARKGTVPSRAEEGSAGGTAAQGLIECVVCPKGCEIRFAGDGAHPEVWGYGCIRGREFAVKEILDPSRPVFSTVATAFEYMPLLPVKTDCPVPLGDVFKVMDAIRGVTVTAPVRRGEILVRGIAGTSANLVASSDMVLAREMFEKCEMT